MTAICSWCRCACTRVGKRWECPQCGRHFSADGPEQSMACDLYNAICARIDRRAAA